MTLPACLECLQPARLRALRCCATALLCALLLLPGVAAAAPPAQAPLPTPTSPTIDAAGTADNLLADGDFERGALSGWEADAGVARSAEQSHSGGWAACLDNATLRSTWLSVQPGAAYKLTAWVKIIAEQLTGDDRWGGFSVRVHDFAWQTLAQSDALLTATHGAAWFKVALPFTATTSSAVLNFGYFGGSGRRMTVCVDDVALLRTQTNRPPVITAALTPLTLDGLPAMQRFTLSGDDPDGAIVRVLWDFGDGGRALGWQGERRVALPGAYTATVTAADDDGAVTTQNVRWSAASAAAPTVTLLTPIANYAIVTTATLPLTGVTSGDVTTVTVSTDRDAAVVAQGAATWRAVLPLRPGVNRILVQAHAAGQVATVERTVRYVPPGALRIAAVAYPASGERWEPLEIIFTLAGSAATHPHLPFDAAPPPGLAWVDGVSVDATFISGDGRTSYTRPAFLQQRYTRALKSGQEWLYPQGEPVWTVRFAPPEVGKWSFRIAAQEAKGVATSGVYSFTVTAPTAPENHGPVRVARSDSRYFEFADGSPFLGAGHGVGFDAAAFSYAAADLFDEIGAGNQNLFRWWISGAIWGSAWQPWRSRTLDSDGYLPATGLTLDRAVGDGLAALRLDAANPILFYGFDSGRPGLIPGRTYRLRVRWRTEGIVAAVAGQPFGVTLKFTGWPEVGDTARYPALIAHVAGDTPWHVAEAEFTATGDFFDQYLTLVLENARDGAAYIDAVTLQEVLADGTPGAQLLRSPRASSHLTFDDRRAAGIDAILAEANRRGLYFKLVISEKNEWLLNHLGPEGLPDPLGGNFDAAPGTPGRWLHEAYWRYLSARYGAYRAVHSWELANESAPGFGAHFRLAAALATYAAQDGNPHLAATSTWATLAEEAWQHLESAPLSYVDFHAYVNGTGWIEPKTELAEDSAGFFAAYDRAAREAAFGKPVVWGEVGIDSAESTDREEPRLADDTEGVWLHKLTWARLGSGGVTPLYWYTENLYAHALHPIFGAWRRFMAGVPLANGRYVDAAATVSNAGLRVLGQKDVAGGQAHLWIDNRAHTWFNVVNGAPIPAVSGTVTLNLGAPRASFTVTWFDTRTGLPLDTEIVAADAAGTLRLEVSNLATDRAVKLARNGDRE